MTDRIPSPLRPPVFRRPGTFKPATVDAGVLAGLAGCSVFVELNAAGRVKALRIGDPSISDEQVGNLRQLADLMTIELLLRPSSILTESGLERLIKETCIRALLVEGKAIATDKISTAIAHSNLERLVIPSSAVTDDGLKEIVKCNSLRVVSLNQCIVTDSCVEAICSAEGLQKLWLEETMITELGIDQIRNGLPECKVFWSRIG